MKCYFCQKECEKYNNGYKVENMYICRAHPYLVAHYESITYHKICKEDNCCPTISLGAVAIKWFHQGKNIEINFFPQQLRFAVYLVYAEDDMKLIFSLPFLPKITPEEFDKKIPNWILFS